MTNATIENLFGDPTRQLVIIGTNALIPHLERSAKFLQRQMGSQEDLTLEIYHESENENFNQSVLMSTARISGGGKEHTPTFKELSIHLDRLRGSETASGIEREMEDLASDFQESMVQRIKIRQLHLKSPMDIIKSDDKIFCSPITHYERTLEDYLEVEKETKLYNDLNAFIHLLQSDKSEVGVFLSKPGDELIWVYDRGGIARGIFPRNAFYTTEFARYSVWGLVFNRKGELLLQQRSVTSKDNRGMWDKSVGGHVDLEDATTALTAKRELIEEMYLPQAEFTKHMKADIGDIIDFGDWLPKKRSERILRDSFRSLSMDDWVMFRALDEKTDLPLTVDRISERLWFGDDSSDPRIRRTVFLSDVYFFLAPQAKDLDKFVSNLAVSDEGAASGYRFISISELADEILVAEEEGKHTLEYTDDLMYLILKHRDLLDSIAAFSTYVSEE